MISEKFNPITLSINLITLLFIFALLFQIGFGRPSTEALAYHPIPDAAEQVWSAIQFANNKAPLIPLSNELHPSRYSPVHPFLISIPLRFSSNKFETIYLWSPFVIILGSVIILIWLQLSGFRPEMIAFLFYLTLTTPLFFDASRELLQDTTLFLLFFSTQFLWYFILTNVDRNVWWYKFLIILTGIITASVISIRPTYFPLPILMLLQFLFLFKKQKIKILLLFLGSLIAASLFLIGFQCWVSGKWLFSGYYHWDPYLKIFSIEQPLIPPSNKLDQTANGVRILFGLLGIDDTWTDFQWPSQVLVLILGIIGVFIPLKKEEKLNVSPQRIFKTQISVLFIFAILQIFIHLFYYFYTSRFFLTIQFILVLCGIYGLSRFGFSGSKREKLG